MLFLFFFVKQKAAYVMRISDWSSDVCSSDLLSTAISAISDGRLLYRGHDARLLAETATLEDVAALLWQAPLRLGTRGEIGRASCSARVRQFVEIWVGAVLLTIKK